MPVEPIRYFDRCAGKIETEAVYGEGLVRWVYGPGRLLADAVLARRMLSRAYGRYQASPQSRRKIAGFIRDFQIPMEDYQVEDYASFNDFFIRRFRPGKRVFTTVPGELPAFSEARYLAFERIREDQIFPVKGEGLSAAGLLGGTANAEPFLGGPLLLARLCPVDYHRFHFPDDGRVLTDYRIQGKFHSVNPVALKSHGDIFVTNERHVSILETKNFGKIAYIEVGAMCVGLIIQTYPQSQGGSGGIVPTFSRGEEKGYFLFGASTVIVLGEPGRWKPDSDLLAQTGQNRETLVRLGERVATVSTG